MAAGVSNSTSRRLVAPLSGLPSARGLEDDPAIGARIDFDRAAHAGGIAGAQESQVPLPASSDTIAVDRTGPDGGRLRFTSGPKCSSYGRPLRRWTGGTSPSI